MIQHTHRTIHSLFQAAKLTNPIVITGEQFASADLKSLQLYELNGMIFFKACSQLWEWLEESGRFRHIHPTNYTNQGYAIGALL